MTMHRILLWAAAYFSIVLLEITIISRLSGSFRLFNGARTRTKDGVVVRSHQEEEDHKPLFILHVGPPKTGTTTIQRFAIKYRALLKQDNVYYVGNGRFEEGICTHELARSCRLGSLEECKTQWEALRKVLDYHHGLNHTVFISEENFSLFLDEGLERDRLFKYLRPLLDRWRVHVIFSYRRHYEFLSSQYMQHHDPAKRPEWKVWPTMGGNETPSFPEFVDSWEQAPGLYEPVSMKTRWQQNFPNREVSIFNFHSDGSLLQNFFCVEIPQAARACQHLRKEKEATVTNPSSSKDLHFDMIAVAAYKRAIIRNKTLTRAEAAQAAKEYASQLGLSKLADFPLEGLSPHQAQALLLHSHKVEQALVPDFYSPNDIESGFQQHMNEHRFASVNTKAVLKDQRWSHFFLSL